MTSFELPDLGEGLREAEIIQWHVSVGDHVVADQPLVSVETDKAVVEIPSPYSGTIVNLLAESGKIVQIGEPIVEIQTGQSEDAGAIVGDIEAGPLPSASKAKSGTASAQAVGVRAAPAVRKLAKQKGIDLATLKGSGPSGAILSSDVLTASDSGVKGEELRGVRLAMASAMQASHTSVVPATLTAKADIHLWNDGENPTKRLVHAIAVAATGEPSLNAWYDGKRRELKSNLDLSIAIDTTEGLFAPVLRNAGDLDNIEGRLAYLRKAVEERTITREEMKGGTFTLSNFGTIDGDHAALVVMPPQVAILGAGRIDDACLAVDGKPVVRRVLPLSLTFDHRVVTGGEAARFMSAVRRDLEKKTIE